MMVGGGGRYEGWVLRIQSVVYDVCLCKDAHAHNKITHHPQHTLGRNKITPSSENTHLFKGQCGCGCSYTCAQQRLLRWFCGCCC